MPSARPCTFVLLTLLLLGCSAVADAADADQKLRELFAPYGVVDRITLITDRDTGRPRGFGFVEMAGDRAAQAAIAGLHGKELAGRAFNVNEAKQREERHPPSGGPRGGGGGRRW